MAMRFFMMMFILLCGRAVYAQVESTSEVIDFIDGLKKPYLIPIDREKMPKRADNISAKAFFVGKNFLKENPNPLYLEFIKEVATALTAYTNTTVTSDSLLGHLIVYGISPEEDPAEMYQPVCEKELKFLWEQMGLSKQPKIAALPVRMDTFYDQLFSQEGKKVIEDAFQLSLTPEKDRPGLFWQRYFSFQFSLEKKGEDAPSSIVIIHQLIAESQIDVKKWTETMTRICYTTLE